jgi:hypothetical protein
LNAVREERVERNCELRERLHRFKHLYWWMEYWGDWLGPGGDRSMPEYELSPLGKAMKRGKDYIASTTGEKDQWNEDLQKIENSLGHLRNREMREKISGYTALYLLHNRKWSLHQIETEFRYRVLKIERDLPTHERTKVTWRLVDTKLWYAYSYLEAGLDHIAPGLTTRPAPIWE